MLNTEQIEAKAYARKAAAVTRAVRLSIIEKVLKNMRADRDELGLAVARRIVEGEQQCF